LLTLRSGVANAPAAANAKTKTKGRSMPPDEQGTPLYNDMQLNVILLQK
jgi:hypothetical protein